MIIGNFKYRAAKDRYEGGITTLTFKLTGVTFEPNEKSGEKEPDYRVMVATENGQFELGAAWRRESDKGRPFVSVALDAPLLAAPLNAALFLDDDREAAALVWTRPSKGRVLHPSRRLNPAEAPVPIYRCLSSARADEQLSHLL